MDDYNIARLDQVPTFCKRRLRMAASPPRKKRKPAINPPGMADQRMSCAALSRRQVADLAQLARRHRHDTLGFLLDMVQMEAEEIVDRRRK